MDKCQADNCENEVYCIYQARVLCRMHYEELHNIYLNHLKLIEMHGI
jgi:hypothetical protein